MVTRPKESQWESAQQLKLKLLGKTLSLSTNGERMQVQSYHSAGGQAAGLSRWEQVSMMHLGPQVQLRLKAGSVYGL